MAKANSAAVWSGSTQFAIPLSTLWSNCKKSKIQEKKVLNKVFQILGHLLFVCVEVLQPSQPNGVMLSTVSLPNHF